MKSNIKFMDEDMERQLIEESSNEKCIECCSNCRCQCIHDSKLIKEDIEMENITKDILTLSSTALNSSMLVSSSVAMEILDYLIDTNADFINEFSKEEEIENAVNTINENDIVLVDKAYFEGKEQYCIQSIDYDPVIESTIIIIEDGVKDLVNYDKLFADEVYEVVDNEN